MWYKKIKLISLFVVLSVAISCTNSNPFILKGQVQDPYNNIFNQGKTYIRLEELKSTKGASKTFLDHPQYLRKDILASVLSSIYFKEKGIKGLSKEQYVFQKSELLKLTSHIADAFTRASPSQYILVNSNYNKGKGLFKSEVYTICALFVSNDKLNVVFSRIQYEGIIEGGREKTFAGSGGTAFVDPFSITKTPFWEISIHSGQRLKKGHDNWLIIDLEKDVFAKKEDYEKKVAPSDKQEESKTNGTGEIISGNPFKGVQPRMSIIKDQLLELKELETTGLINNEDYETRKAVILGSSKREKNIKDKFNELRKLKEEGFINNIDYDHKKRDLLEKNDEGERGKNIKEILAEYLELRNEGFITDGDYEYKKKKLLKEF
ncbi:MAG: hypothetical protein ACUZ8N_05130 [Candidatus Scalindua sp.]